MVIPHQVDTSIRGRMGDVRKAFEAGAFLSAISMALTLPDICGDRLYSGSSSSERYSKWFDKYVAPSYVGPRPDEPDAWDIRGADVGPTPCFTSYFSGDDCYQLRCVYLHEGVNAPHVERNKTPFNVIQFRVFDEMPAGCDGIEKMQGNLEPDGFLKIDLDLRKFLDNLEAGIDRFLNEHPEMNDDRGSDSFLYQPVLDFRSGIAREI